MLADLRILLTYEQSESWGGKKDKGDIMFKPCVGLGTIYSWKTYEEVRMERAGHAGCAGFAGLLALKNACSCDVQGITITFCLASSLI